MYKVISGFKCPHTKRIYHVGEIYDGEHHEEMQAKVYIVGSEDAPKDEKIEWPKHIGGGIYQLSNGEKIKGKEAAFKAQAALEI